MKKSEKALLGVFTTLFLILVGGGGFMMLLEHHRGIAHENDTMRDRLAAMQLILSQGAEAAAKYHWLDQNMPSFPSAQAASARLLESITSTAAKHSLTISGKEFLEDPVALSADGLPPDTPTGYFDKACVKITLVNVSESALFQWLEDLQRPKSFIGVSRLQLNPTGSAKTVNCEVEFTQFHRERRSLFRAPPTESGRPEGL